MAKIKNEFDRVYVIKYLNILGKREIAESFFITVKELENVISDITQKGLYNYYRDMSEEEWEKLDGKTKKEQKDLVQKGFIEYQKRATNFKQFLELILKEIPTEEVVFEQYDERQYEIKNQISVDIKNETWKQILDSDYEVSDFGRIKNTITNKIIYGKLDRGTLRVRFSIKGLIKSQSISRIVAQAFLGEVSKNQTIIHKDGNGMNNRVDNLLIVDKKEKFELMGKQSAKKTEISIVVYDKENKNKTKYNSIREAAAILHISKNTINAIIKGEKEHDKYLITKL